MPAMPSAARIERSRRGDPRYIEGQRLLVEAIRYLVQSNPEDNRLAIELLSELFRTRFRMSDKLELLHSQA